MSTLEKTINLLNVLPEKQIEMIYSFVQFLSSQQTIERADNTIPLDEIFGNIVGAVPDTGKSLEEYREERIRQRWRDFEDCVQYMTGENNGIDYVITSNRKDYTEALLPVVTPTEWLEIVDDMRNI